MTHLAEALGELGHHEAYPVMVDAVRCVQAEGLKTALLTNNWFTDEQKSASLLPVDTSIFDVVNKTGAHFNKRNAHRHLPPFLT
jgi:acyl-CoA dehydrogenase family protein 10